MTRPTQDQQDGHRTDLKAAHAGLRRRMKKLTPDQQIDAIVKMMVQGQWKGSASSRKLAQEWECHPRTVGDRAVAASAVVKRAGGPIEGWILLKMAELEHVKEVAMRLKRPVVVNKRVRLFNAPDTKAAEKAIRLQLEARGALNHVKKTQEVPADGAALKDLVKAILGDEHVRAEVLAQLKEELH